MLQSFLIVFRETLEAALVIGIVLGYLRRTEQRRFRTVTWLAVAAGVAASVLAAFLFRKLAGGFEGRAEQIFEGLTMLAGAALLTTLILWMMRKADAASRLEKQVERKLAEGSGSRSLGLFLLVFISILREGVETVIFLAGGTNLAGALAGLAAAVLLGYLLFRGFLRFSLRGFFAATNVLLILFAAGLLAHGIHELQEAGWIPAVVEHVWDLNPPARGESYPLLHENGALGSLAKGLFGYNGDPSLIEVLGYALYVAAVAVLWIARRRRPNDPRA